MSKDICESHQLLIQEFKKASRLSNFKNVSLSLTNTHQRWMCYKMASGNLINNSIECGLPRLGDEFSLLRDKPADIKHNVKGLFPQLNEESSVFCPAWISKLSTSYKVNSSLIIGSNGLVVCNGY